MLIIDHLLRELGRRREEFTGFDARWRDDVDRYAQHLASLGLSPAEEVRDRALAAADAPGALPSDEMDSKSSTVVLFGRAWRSHEDSRRWALAALEGRTTFAADGSQIVPGRDITLPVAAVQVGTFENPHRRDGTYVKDVRLELVTPGELMTAETDADSLVALRRFEGEVAAVAEFVERRAGWRGRGERMPLAFFDGTLLISYARPRNPLQDVYVEKITGLVRLSERHGVPLVGYIDHSFARDLVNLLERLEGLRSGYNLYDAQVLRAREDDLPLLGGWGDRTAFFYCVRQGHKEDFADERGEPLVGFTYLQTTADGFPARLDVPSWVYRAGLLDEVVDAVRAECVVGGGYPYALEAADAAAVVTAQDRERFLRALQEFAAREGVYLRVSQKPGSKSRRR